MTFIQSDSKIYVAGHCGMVGSAILRRLRDQGFENLVVRSHVELDLLDQNAVHLFFQQEQVDCVILAAAKVGGILANSIYPVLIIFRVLKNRSPGRGHSGDYLMTCIVIW